MSHIAVQIAKSFETIDVDLSRIEELVKSICARFKLHKATVSIAIVDRKETLKINKKFLNCDSDTDVISFDLSDEQGEKSFELVVNAEKAVDEAKKRHHCSEAELALYITHGLLHNLGFDDSSDQEAKKMHETEDLILHQLGFGTVFNSN